jgi:2-succinyl-6-hydroxy-2,4-cyclohexadiene-1-carboxylate synthase
MKLNFERWGKGPQPLLVLHGFTGDRSTWRHLEPYWGGAFRVTAVDLPGHGDSPPPEQPGAAGFEETVAGLAELLDACGTGPTPVLGYSLGARLALALAVQHPDRVARLVLESGSPGLNRRKARSARRRDDESLAGFILERGIEAFVERWEALPLFSTLRQLPQALRDGVHARRLSARPEGLASALRALGTGVQPNLWPLLPSLHVPTLLITGGLDAKFSELAQQMATQLPVAWFHVVPEVGHAPHLEAPALYADEVVRFLSTPWFDVPEIEPGLEIDDRRMN